MPINHLEPGYTDNAAPEIEEFGGKIGGLKFIERRVPKLADRFPPTQIILPGGEWKGSPYSGKNIVRGSHRNDFQGLVDILPTEVVEGSIEQVRAAINLIRNEAAGSEVMAYGQYENPNYDGKVVIAVQPHAKKTWDYRRGSIVEHPNKPGKYFVTEVHDYSLHDRDVSSALFDEKGNVIKQYREVQNDPTLIEIYKAIRAAGLVRDDLSFQMEFGREPGELPYIFQVRAFTRKAIADFSIDEEDATNGFAFGVTPAKGIELAVFHSRFEDGSVPQPNEDFALLSTSQSDGRIPDFMPRGMRGYLSASTFGFSAIPNLEHSNYWKIQKADVSVLGERSRNFEDLMLDSNGNGIDGEKGARIKGGTYVRDSLDGLQPKRVRIIADGDKAIVQPM
ncbi:MAG: hypothetical protein Q7R81_05640 [Candidatus Peregrinibacteria bacterium]|nr:hypothetical protein [Candidatus Peregrinibacteria bacterium]